MAINTKAVKTRISSVKNTRKITRAMQMIAAVKMRKAVDAAISTRLYARLAKELMENLGHSEIEHPLTEGRDIKNELLIVITSNRGLCGSYNSSVFKKMVDYVKDNQDKEIEVIALGRKAAGFAKKLNLKLNGIYEKFSENREFEDVRPISNTVIEEFTSKKFDSVKVIFTNYISGLSSEAEILSLLPISLESVQAIYDKTGAGKPVDEEREDFLEYDFEPQKESLVKFLLPMLIEVQIYQSILESAASEHSSRMMAMKNATEAAGEMIEDLTLEYNKGRQAAITSEIAEISAGANAIQ